MRITVPDEIMRLTVPTCTPSRDNPLVIVSSLEVGGPDLHSFVSVLSVLQVGCLRDLDRSKLRLYFVLECGGPRYALTNNPET